MTLNYLLKNWVNNELRCRLCSCFVFQHLFFLASSSLSECVTAPPLCNCSSPLLLRPQLLFNNVLDVILSFFTRLMAHADSKFWVRDSVQMVYFGWQVLFLPWFKQYMGKNGFFLSKMEFTIGIEVHAQLTLLCFSCTKAQGFDCKSSDTIFCQGI